MLIFCRVGPSSNLRIVDANEATGFRVVVADARTEGNFWRWSQMYFGVGEQLDVGNRGRWIFSVGEYDGMIKPRELDV
jgi:hypothetical protein